MSREQLEPFDPVISNNYLKSGVEVLPVIEDHIDDKGIRVKPSALENTPYFLDIHEQDGNTEGSRKIHIRIVNEHGEPINRPSGYDFIYYPGTTEAEIMVTGIAFNNTHRREVIKQKPVRNLSGIMAPYEDAICQNIANKSGKSVRRRVKTSEPVDSKFVQNYLRRGYGRTPDRGDDRGGTLVRLFFPKDKKLVHSKALH